MPLMKISGEWLEVLENFKTALSPVIFICGHRKVGKSSFSRFLLNGLLNGGGEV
jgi:polynucleotide 5'-kinase involved in rRNA processing